MPSYSHNRDRDKSVATTIFPGSDELKRDSRGDFLGHEHNVSICLKGTMESFLAYNLLTHEACYAIHPPWHDRERDGEDLPRIDDYQISQILTWVHRYDIPARRQVVEDMLSLVAKEFCAFHPVRQYFDGLTWDGISRVDSFFHNELGSEDSDYTQLASRILLISAVARVYEPGCKGDTCVVLVGPQGSLKSTAARILSVQDEWYADGLGIEGKINTESCMIMEGRLIVELGNIDQYMAGTSRPRLKNLLSRQSDVFKRPYGKRMTEQPRGCIFIGTTDSEYFLRDQAGNRRFIPVCCWTRPNLIVNVNSLYRMRDQYWAEAVQLYRDGVSWYPEGKLQYRMMADRAMDHTVYRIVDAALDEYLLGHSIRPGHLMGSVTIPELVAALAVSETWKSQLSDPELTKYIPNYLRRLGYERRRGDDGSGNREPNGRLQRSREWVLEGE